jgi:hypothetical protein
MTATARREQYEKACLTAVKTALAESPSLAKLGISVEDVELQDAYPNTKIRMRLKPRPAEPAVTRTHPLWDPGSPNAEPWEDPKWVATDILVETFEE